ncbi:hypothetical protein BU14_0711s0005 [Porphyra umbilicalis]|uniref:DNA-directed RNA polymerases I and III subunit RPAC1 n=1 Tax=Porphyra umbilicalis TaxID=2786 RepID=A0A1X6NPR2_PORUM|nr:hypothetical protein BU14_0711s0005 [Porphyra umbilicalis]|eukprot:OSX70608.1 hypothetical protein BU14_0711s0005 [Porphyra umbilicalis]
MEVDTTAALAPSAAAVDGAGAKLPPHLERIRSRVEIGLSRPTNTAGTYGANTYTPAGFDNSLTPALFAARLSMAVSVSTSEELVFDMAGLDAPIANALRRILLAEVPSVAIERVLIRNNTSIVHDEMLAHRLGLVPLRVDIGALQDVPPPADGEDPTTVPYTAANHVVLRLKVRCTAVPGASPDAPPTVRYRNAHVLSGRLEWTPVGDQAAWLVDGVAPVHDDILLAKLRPGQEIDVEAHAVRGVGRVHAKWSPVATAFYRMLPEVTLRRRVSRPEAEALVAACPARVFDLEDVGGGGGGGGWRWAGRHCCAPPRVHHVPRVHTVARAGGGRLPHPPAGALCVFGGELGRAGAGGPLPRRARRARRQVPSGVGRAGRGDGGGRGGGRGRGKDAGGGEDAGGGIEAPAAAPAEEDDF